MWRRAVPSLSTLCVPVGYVAVSFADGEASKKEKMKQREVDFTLKSHQHGKTRVRVLKVRRGDDGVHSVSEYNVALTLFSPVYERVFTQDNNTDLVATDTQKNTVYVVAKRTEAQTPEDFGIALVDHMLTEYPVLTGARADVQEVSWKRAEVADARLSATTNGQNGAAASTFPHAHGFLRTEPEHAKARVSKTRGDAAYAVESSIGDLVLLKTTQSGFENFGVDRYTLLPPCTERCMATELNTTWKYGKTLPKDFAATRAAVRAEICRGFFGPPTTGIYSASLQATVYDAGCLVLSALATVEQIEIDTPNLHYLPQRALAAVGETFENDIFIPTSEPSGSINCCVSRADLPAGLPTTAACHKSSKTVTEGSPGSCAAKARAVGSIEEAIVTPKANSCPMAVRLAWHASGTYDAASGTGGSDGATMRFDPERADGANAGLSIERDILQPVTRANPEISVADAWALAGATAVKVCGGPEVAVKLGRTDAPSGASCPPNGRLPDATQGAAHLREVFGRMGLGDREIVALSGAHTLGRCHKTRSGFDGPWTTKPLVFDNEYFTNLVSKTWVVRDWDGNFQYTDKETGTLTMLPTDLALITDPAFNKHVQAYAKDEQLFFKDFKEAYETLLALGCPATCQVGAPATGASAPQGQQQHTYAKWSLSADWTPGSSFPAADTELDAEAAGEMREHCMHGSIEHAKAALAKRPNSDVQAADAGSLRTGLHKAAFWGHDHIIPWLLDDLKLHPNAKDAAGDTALHDAARFGHAKVVHELLKRNVDVTVRNNDGMTALDVANLNNKDEVIPALRKTLGKAA